MSRIPPDGPQVDLERRKFIKLSATGVAASLAGCATSASPEAAPSTPEPTAPAEPPAAEPPRQEVQRAPEVGNLVGPDTPFLSENWQEPWTWRPHEWPDAHLELNVIRNQAPGHSTSPGNPTAELFSYNGTSPAPTVRAKSDGVVRIRVRNTLGLNEQDTQVGPAPDPVDVAPGRNRDICSLAEDEIRGGDPNNPRRCNAFFFPDQLIEVLKPETRPGWSFKHHINGQHAAHTTNLHTHGLHVHPETNPDGTHSDNVMLRVIPKADWEARKQSDDPDLHELGDHEHVGELDYEIRLAFERDGEPMAHPPGTHWYHPHSHGATHDQVASGMAGFLIVEGDVDEAVNRAMTGEAWPDPAVKTGPYDYRERLMFVQKNFLGSADPDAGARRDLRFPPPVAVNGAQAPPVIFMRPGAVERWRVLNGGVDGSSTIRFMVLEGQYVHRQGKMWRVVTEGEGDERSRRLEPVSQQEIEDAKLDLHQLSFDGITLVTEENGRARHTIRDLSQQNAGTVNPFAREPKEGEDDVVAMLKAYEDCFRNGDSLRKAFVRPNEVFLGNANRADLFVEAPRDAAGKIFTVFAQEAHLHTDNLPRQLQRIITNRRANPRRPLVDVVLGYVFVRGDAVEGERFDVQSLAEQLPPVPPLLQPVREEELRVPADEARRARVPVGSARTRVIGYSGTGGADFPRVIVPEEFAHDHPELEGLVWGIHQGVPILLPNLTRTMAISSDLDLAHTPEPKLPRKFMPGDPQRSRMLVNTAEEWVLYNSSQTLWSHTDRERYPQPGSFAGHFESYPVSNAEGQRRFWEDPEFRITSKGADHPFHIHINPMWVLRIDVPDENGDLHNILPQPQWMDTVPIPRNGGRVVFRTRFDDFVGTWVHHCHILLHEDMGMMQVVECTDRVEDANYHPRDVVASADMEAAAIDAIYPKPSPELMYRLNMCFVDPNELGYQVYPGFDFEVPELVDE